MTDARGRARLRAATLEKLGNVCAICGFADQRALQVDHIKGGGSNERTGGGQNRMYRKILEGSEDYQLLCANCNAIKRFTARELITRQGEHPKGRRGRR